VAAVGRAVLAGAAVLPRLRPGEDGLAVHPRPAVLVRGGAGDGRHVLDAVRLGPADDATAVTASQLRDVVDRLITTGQWQPCEPDILIVTDAGYDVTRLAWVLRGLPAELVGRVRGDRVMRLPKPPRLPGTNGRPPKHGPEFRFAEPETWPEPAVTTRTATANYGKAVTQVWDRVHPRLTHRASWLDPWAGPVSEGVGRP
jgi:hypothetical protein